MRNTITLNGIPSSEIPGLLIQSLPPISKPLMRTEIEEIDGRDGDIITNLGFSAYDKEISVGLHGDFDINQVIAYFNSEGTVTFSNEPDKYYNYQIINQIDFARLVRYRTATVTLHCQPFKYSDTEGSDTLQPETSNLLNLPNFTNTTNGVTLTVSNNTITVTGTPTAATEFYVATNSLTLQPGSYTLSASANGTRVNSSAIRLIGSAPSNADSLGGNYVSLVNNQTVRITGTVSAAKTFNYLWFYITTGGAINYTMTAKVENEAEKTATGEGSFITLENTSENPFAKLTPKGDTFQQTYSGKNLAKIDDLTATSYGLDYTFSSSGTITINNTSTATSSAGANNDYPISLVAGQTYTLSLNNPAINSDVMLRFQREVGGVLSGAGASAANRVFTFTAENTENVRLQVRVASGVTLENFTMTPQLELGSTATDYEKFVGGIPSPNPDYSQDINVVTGDQTVKVTGKNLAQLQNGDAIASGITASRSSATGEVVLNGTSTATATINATVLYSINIVEGETYTMSANNAEANSSVSIRLNIRNVGSYQNFYLNTVNRTNTFTSAYTGECTLQVRVSSGKTLNNYSFHPQVELSATASAFEPYQSQSYPISLGSTELCGIEKKPDGTYTYQDYIWKDGSDWKVHKAVEKIVFNGSETGWGINGTGTANYFYRFRYITDYDYIYTNDRWLCNQASPASISGSNTEEGCFITQSGEVRLRYGAELPIDDFKANLAIKPILLYYALATPTDTAITDETLIAQLEALNAAHAYKGRTHIISTAESDANLPHIVEAAVLKSSDGTITNSGNYYARPKLTIYGSGDISIFLNGVQLFQVALGNEGYITIDTNAMEAYKDTTDNLKNRLVTGEYNNFKLNPGENQITFSGEVTSCVVDNYSRWL